MSDSSTTTYPAWVVILFLAPVLTLMIWQINSTILPPPAPPAQFRGKRIVLLIAHPDDESMFFSPALLRLTEPSMGNHVKILCLSTGNADGLGEIRRTELESAALTLGIRKPEDVLILDDPRFRDGMKEHWKDTDIAEVLLRAFAPDAIQSKKKNKDGPRATIDTLVTFDQHGISSHANHVALYHGAKTFLRDLMRDHAGYASPISLYTLTTISILRKYNFALDLLPTYFVGIFQDIIAGASGKKKVAKKGVSKGSKGDRVVFLSDFSKYSKARHAMVHGHKTQMVWFRWGWISIGRYMVVNDLKKEDV